MRPAFYSLPRGGWRDYVTLLHLPVYGLEPLLRRRRRLPRRRGVVGPARADRARVLPRRRYRRPRARRARGQAAPDDIPARDAGRARGRLGRRSLCARGRRRARLQPLDPAADRLRSVHRPGLQPRAVRRPLPLRPLVGPRLGGVSRSSPATSPAPAPSAARPSSPPPGQRSSSLAQRRLSTPVRRIRRDVVAVTRGARDRRRRAGGDHPRDARRGPGGRAAAAGGLGRPHRGGARRRSAYSVPA